MAFPARKTIRLTTDTTLSPEIHSTVLISGTNVTITLPADPLDNDLYTIMNIRPDETVTVDRNGEKINGDEINLTLTYLDSICIQFCGGVWWDTQGAIV